jgi:hypothetical protein
MGFDVNKRALNRTIDLAEIFNFTNKIRELKRVLVHDTQQTAPRCRRVTGKRVVSGKMVVLGGGR